MYWIPIKGKISIDPSSELLIQTWILGVLELILPLIGRKAEKRPVEVKSPSQGRHTRKPCRRHANKGCPVTVPGLSAGNQLQDLLAVGRPLRHCDKWIGNAQCSQGPFLIKFWRNMKDSWSSSINYITKQEFFLVVFFFLMLATVFSQSSCILQATNFKLMFLMVFFSQVHFIHLGLKKLHLQHINVLLISPA